MNPKVESKKRGAAMVPLNTPVGDRDLCAWQPVPGIIWVQTRNPRHARRMSRRKDCRLVVRGVAGGYLMTCEFEQRLSWALRLMARYVSDEKATNERVFGAI